MKVVAHCSISHSVDCLILFWLSNRSLKILCLSPVGIISINCIHNNSSVVCVDVHPAGPSWASLRGRETCWNIYLAKSKSSCIILLCLCLRLNSGVRANEGQKNLKPALRSSGGVIKSNIVSEMVNTSMFVLTDDHCNSLCVGFVNYYKWCDLVTPWTSHLQCLKCEQSSLY